MFGQCSRKVAIVYFLEGRKKMPTIIVAHLQHQEMGVKSRTARAHSIQPGSRTTMSKLVEELIHEKKGSAIPVMFCIADVA